MIGALGELREPTTATRIVAVRLSLKDSRLRAGDRASVSVSLRSTWATAKDVAITVSSASPNLIVRNGTQKIGEIAGGATVASPMFELEAAPLANARARTVPEAGTESFPTLLLTITAAGGYRQVVQLLIWINEP